MDISTRWDEATWLVNSKAAQPVEDDLDLPVLSQLNDQDVELPRAWLEILFLSRMLFRYLTLVQFGFYSLFSSFETRGQPRVIPFSTYAFLALATLAAMGFTNASLGYLNFPTQVIFKSCKLIPVLVGGILIQRKNYGIIDVSAALVMCIGLAVFTLADSQVLDTSFTHLIYPRYYCQPLAMF